jgi:hypothetical protein
MRLLRPRYEAVALACCLCLGVAGCAIDRGPVYTKDGKDYGVTSSKFWRNTWWQNYERGLSYAEGEFWDDAVTSFQAALATRLGQQDQRRANTYGLHFIDHYFPHRELGIVYYRLGRYHDALHQLSTSLDHVESAKAKFYLNKVRRALLQQTGRDTTPPRLGLDSPADGLVLNRFTVTVTGHVDDDTYVSAVAINGQPLLIELAVPHLPFTEEVALQDGPNPIEIMAQDLLGQRTSQRLTVHLDRHGPLLSLEQVELLGAPPHLYAQVQGVVSDASRITRFVLAGRQMPLLAETAWAFRQELPVSAGTGSLPFSVEDAAGNVTRGDIALTPDARQTPKPQQGHSVPSGLRRWAFLSQDATVSDLVAWPTAPLRVAQQQDRDPPRITFTGSEDREVVYDNTIYLEGKVTDASPITAFSIAGESHWKHKCYQLFFGYVALLRAGQMNGFLLEAADEQGNRGERAVRVMYQRQPIQQLGARLRVLLLPFATTGQPSVLTETVLPSLFDALVTQKRFHVIERQLTVSQPALAEPAAAARMGKTVGAEGILIGTVIEAEKRHSLDVYVRFVDADTETVLATEDVYGEDLAPRDVKTLMTGLAVKLQRHFPRAEGVVVAREGQQLWANFPSHRHLQPGMRLLLFRDGKTIEHGGRKLQTPASVLGEARITALSADLVAARVLPSTSIEEVRVSDKAMLK